MIADFRIEGNSFETQGNKIEGILCETCVESLRNLRLRKTSSLGEKVESIDSEVLHIFFGRYGFDV